MTGRLAAAALIIPGMFALVVTSAAQHMNSPEAPCQQPMSGIESTSCFADAAKKVDTDLNRTYAKITSVLKDRSDDLNNLRAAQRLWIQFRDASCKAEHAMYEGGSAAAEVNFACIEELTRQRTADLKVTYGWVVEKFGDGKL